MSQVLIAIEIVVGACAALALALLVVLFVRRRVLARGGDLIMCALRRSERARWKPGLLRFDDSSLAWFPLFGVRLRPRYCWDRAGLELANGRRVDLFPSRVGDDGASVLAQLQGRERGKGVSAVELALADAPYTALRSWVEASPPGRQPVEW